MSRFTRGDRVITPSHGAGVIETAFGGARSARRTYSVAIDGQRHALVFGEHELRAEPTAPGGDTVRCTDCANKLASTYAASTVRCSVFRQLRSANAPRACKSFVPIKEEIRA